jgi:hypothetical protein
LYKRDVEEDLSVEEVSNIKDYSNAEEKLWQSLDLGFQEHQDDIRQY